MEPTILACMAARVAWADLSKQLPELLGEVWTFLRTAPVKVAGNNVAVYCNPRSEGADVQAGVQWTPNLQDGERILCRRTPSGSAAHAILIGPHPESGKAHDAIIAFCGRRGFPPGVPWEVYGDWNEDPRQLRTDVYRKIG